MTWGTMGATQIVQRWCQGHCKRRRLSSWAKGKLWTQQEPSVSFFVLGLVLWLVWHAIPAELIWNLSLYFYTANTFSDRIGNRNRDPGNAMPWRGSPVFPREMHVCPESQAKRPPRQWSSHIRTNHVPSTCEYISLIHPLRNIHRASSICAIVALSFVLYKVSEKISAVVLLQRGKRWVRRPRRMMLGITLHLQRCSPWVETDRVLGSGKQCWFALYSGICNAHFRNG